MKIHVESLSQLRGKTAKHMFRRVAAFSMLAALAGVWGFTEDSFEEGSIEVSPYIGWNYPNKNIESGGMFGLRAGYFFTDAFSAEAEFNMASSGIENTPVDASISNYRASGLYNWHIGDGRWIPYAKLGLGFINFNPDGNVSNTDFALNAGGGVRYVFHHRWGARAEALRVLGGDVDTVEANVGLSFSFGGRHSEPEETVRDIDSDGDGIYDRMDNCPRTPKGASVDSHGCPMDSDSDSVLNGLDTCPHSASGALVDAAGCQLLDQTFPVGVFVYLENVYFDTDKSNIDLGDTRILDRLVTILKHHPAMVISVAGHADSRGTEEYNQKLSEQRALAVLDYLVRHGVATSRVSPVGHGETMPQATNLTPSGRALNRGVLVRRTT